MASKRKGKKEKSNVVQLRKQEDNLTREYLAALNEFWGGRPRTAIESLSKVLSHEISAEEAFPLYRLWIEILAHQGEAAALKELAGHFVFCQELHGEEENSLTTFLALKGMLHFELDEMEATALVLRVLHSHSANPYVAELQERFDNRQSSKKVTTPLFNLVDNLWDYLHIQTLAGDLLLKGDHKNLLNVLKRAQDLYPESPLNDAFAMHLALDEGQLEDAKKHADQLATRFPGNSGFGFEKAYLDVRLENFDQAIAEFDRITSMTGQEDPDVLAWQGLCWARKATAQKNSNFKTKAEGFLRKAVVAYQQAGLPTRFPQRQLNKLHEAFGETPNMPADHRPRLWFVKLSHGNFSELQTASQKQVNRIGWSLGEECRAGDMVLFVGQDYTNRDRNSDSFRILALYTVASEPYWHPLMKQVHELRLVNRLEGITIPVDFAGYIQSNGAIEDNRVYALRDEAGKVIDSALQDFLDEGGNLYEALSTFRQSI